MKEVTFTPRCMERDGNDTDASTFTLVSSASALQSSMATLVYFPARDCHGASEIQLVQMKERVVLDQRRLTVEIHPVRDVPSLHITPPTIDFEPD